MVEARIAQGGLYGLAGEFPPVRVAQGGMYALAKIGTPLHVAQGGMYSLTAITPQIGIAQAGMYVLAAGAPCVSEWCQVWRIVRTDGQVFRFTSLDHDWEWLGEEYQACDSLSPSASENVAQADEAGNMDLSGAVGENGIKPRELFMGLFDGAVVDAWLVPYEGEGRQKLLVRGTFGPVEQTDTGFKVELLGDGAKLMQTPLIQLIQPDCRWEFGNPITCGVDLGPLTVTGTVDSGVGQRQFTDAARVETAGYFTRGRITWVTGSNAGKSAEIRIHSAGGVFELWPRVPYAIVAGDQYSMTPGCTNLKESVGGTNGCEAWANLGRYGGFRNVPGRDRRNKPADAKPPGTG